MLPRPEPNGKANKATMFDEGREQFLVLTERGITLLDGSAAAAATGKDLQLIECALAGDQMLSESCPDVGMQDLAAIREWVLAVPCPSRYWYPWIVVDVSRDGTAFDAALREGLDLIEPGKRGLVLSFRGDWPESPSAEIVTAAQCRLSSWVAFIQYVRAILLNLPRARVLLTAAEDGIVFGRALARHTIAAAASADLAAVSDGLRQPAQDWRTTLRQLVAPEPGVWIRNRASIDALEAVVPDLAVVFALAEDVNTRERLRRMVRRGMVLPATATALATYLCDGDGMRRKPPPHEDHITLRSIDLKRRSPKNAPRRVLYSCLHLLGDALNATPILRQHRRDHADDHITFLVPDEPYARIFELCPEVDEVAYMRTAGHHDIVLGSTRQFLESLPFDHDFDEHYVLDIQEVARDAFVGAQHLHMAEGYAHRLGRTIASRRPSLDIDRLRSARPTLQMGDRYAVLSRHSVSGVIGPGAQTTKRWADSKWQRLARLLRREFGLAVVSIGTPGERPLATKGVTDLHDLSILEVAALLADATILISVDNGIYHLGQAVGCPTVHLMPHWLPANWTALCPELRGRDIIGRLPNLTVARVFSAAADLLAEIGGSNVEAR